MKAFSLAIAWNWEFDQDFIAGIERECASRSVTTFLITSHNLKSTLSELKQGSLTFRAFFDRASDADPEFLPLVNLLNEAQVYCINPWERVVRAIDKATMHRELIEHGIDVPPTIILPPFRRNGLIEVDPEQLNEVGRPFVIKPANTTGGGTGVVLGAATVEQIIEARKEHQDDKYLVQKMIVPKLLGGKRAWFRVYSVFDTIIPCWWDDTTHMYSELSAGDEEAFNLGGLGRTMESIREICGLDFFSSEIALTGDGKFTVVDYVNEVCDMRLKSKFYNGAPDAVVGRIEVLIAERVRAHIGTPEPTAPARIGT